MRMRLLPLFKKKLSMKNKSRKRRRRLLKKLTKRLMKTKKKSPLASLQIVANFLMTAESLSQLKTNHTKLISRRERLIIIAHAVNLRINHSAMDLMKAPNSSLFNSCLRAMLRTLMKLRRRVFAAASITKLRVVLSAMVATKISPSGDQRYIHFSVRTKPY